MKKEKKMIRDRTPFREEKAYKWHSGYNKHHMAIILGVLPPMSLILLLIFLSLNPSLLSNIGQMDVPKDPGLMKKNRIE